MSEEITNERKLVEIEILDSEEGKQYVTKSTNVVGEEMFMSIGSLSMQLINITGIDTDLLLTDLKSFIEANTIVDNNAE